MLVVQVVSNKNNKEYLIERLKEFEVETSLDIPADYFKLSISNPLDAEGKGMHSELFNPNDEFIIKENRIILNGISDDIDEFWDNETGNSIDIVGRDKSLLLLENDAIPATYYNLTLSSLINKIAGPYGFKANVNSEYNKTIKKIVVEVGMSEWDVLFEEIKKLGLWIWCDSSGVLRVDRLNYNDKPSYLFSNNVGKEVEHIKILKLFKKKRGADIKNEVWVRGHGKKAFNHKYKDEELTKLNYNRRIILEDGDAKDIGSANNTAKNTIKDRKKGSFEIEVEINGKYEIELNKIATIKDLATRIHGNYLIIGIKHIKSINSGNIKKIRMRPLWEGL